MNFLILRSKQVAAMQQKDQERRHKRQSLRAFGVVALVKPFHGRSTGRILFETNRMDSYRSENIRASCPGTTFGRQDVSALRGAPDRSQHIPDLLSIQHFWPCVDISNSAPIGVSSKDWGLLPKILGQCSRASSGYLFQTLAMVQIKQNVNSS
jgi:hypothetical protein